VVDWLAGCILAQPEVEGEVKSSFSLGANALYVERVVVVVSTTEVV